jgi:hypothetical protein
MSRTPSRSTVFLLVATLGAFGVVGVAAFMILGGGTRSPDDAGSLEARRRLYGPAGRPTPKPSPELTGPSAPLFRPRGMQFSGGLIDDPEDRPTGDETPAPEPLAIDKDEALKRFRDALGECEDWRQKDSLPDRRTSRGLYLRLENGFEAVSGFADGGSRGDREFLELAYGEMMNCMRDLDLRRPKPRQGTFNGP